MILQVPDFVHDKDMVYIFAREHTRIYGEIFIGFSKVS